MPEVQYSKAVVIERVAGNTERSAIMRAMARLLGNDVPTTYVECRDRRDSTMWYTFIAYGRTAKQAQHFLRAGDEFIIEYVAADIDDYDGEITGMREIARYIPYEDEQYG